MGLDVADDYIQALSLALVSCFQHGIRFAHTRGVAQKYLKMTASGKLLLRLHLSKELVRVRATRSCVHPELLYPIQRQVKLEHIDTWFTKYSELPSGSILIHELPYGLFAHSPHFSHA